MKSMKVYRKIGGKTLVVTKEEPENQKHTRVIFLNYKNKGQVKLIKNFNTYFEYIRESTEIENDLYYNELVS